MSIVMWHPICVRKADLKVCPTSEQAANKQVKGGIKIKWGMKLKGKETKKQRQRIITG
jgi:hypothetical protein